MIVIIKNFYYFFIVIKSLLYKKFSRQSAAYIPYKKYTIKYYTSMMKVKDFTYFSITFIL